MADIHYLILSQGVEAARRQAVTKHERQLVEAAFRVLTDEQESIGFTYSGFALTSLPHKEQKETVWKREGHNITLVLQSGADRTGKWVGLPYGSHARFILLFLQSEAVRKGTREVELGGTMREWMSRMGLTYGGKTARLVREQARRISMCRLTFFGNTSDQDLLRHGGFVEGALNMSSALYTQPSLWNDRVLLDETFYKALCAHPVPVSETALRAIGPRSASIDIYVWLAYRLHALRRDTLVSWVSLYTQFGAGYKRIRAFRQEFTSGLELALAAYPDARVSVDDRGVTLHPSRPAIAKRQ